MKKALSLLIGGAIVASCSSPSIKYSISGSVQNESMEGQMAYLMDINNMRERVDSAKIIDQSFAFEGKVNQPSIYTIAAGRASAEILLDKSAQNITVQLAEQGASVVDDNGGINSKSTTASADLDKSMIEIRTKLQKKVEDGGDMEQINQEYMDAIFSEIDQIIAANSNNLIGVTMLIQRLSAVETLDEADSLIANVKLAADFEPVNQALEQLENIEATQEGKKFTDFKGCDQEQKEVSLSDYVGKGDYVLVDFWASWCGPCRGEISNLQSVHKSFGDKNFKVVGVNVWDKFENFTKSIDHEKMEWAQIYIEGNGAECEATHKYGIRGIPEIILFAPDGTIIKRGLRGEAIEAQIRESMGL